jgi:hypothetical protein
VISKAIHRDGRKQGAVSEPIYGAALKQSSFKLLYVDCRKCDVILEAMYSAPCHPDIFLCGDYLDLCI